MKKTFEILICSCIILISFLSSCDNDNPDYSGTKAPKISLILDSIVPDMNKTDNIPLLCVVFSEAGLNSVKMYVVKGTEETLYKEVITFYDAKQYSLKELPQWQDDITAFRIVATDNANRSTEAIIPVSVIKYKAAPVITFEKSEIVIDENEGSTQIPITKFEVRAATVLSTIEITLFRKTGPVVVESNPTFVANSDSIYRFSQDIIYQDGDRSLQVKATDAYGKSKIETLPIKYIPVPYPEMTVTGNTTLDPIIAKSGTSKTLTFKATSVIGIMSVKVYKIEKGVETELTDISKYYNSETEVNFTAGLNNIQASWNAIKIVAYDQLGRSVSLGISTIIDLNYKANLRIGSQYYAKTADANYPNTYCFLSVNDLKTYNLQYFFNNKSNIDLTFYIFLGAPDIRIYSPVVNRNDAYCAGWSADAANSIPAMIDGETAWNGKNNTLTKQYSAGVWPFSFENVTADDLTAVRDGSFFNSGAGTIPGLKVGDVIFFKTATTSTAPSKVGMMRIESFTFDAVTKWKGYYIVSFKVLQ